MDVHLIWGCVTFVNRWFQFNESYIYGLFDEIDTINKVLHASQSPFINAFQVYKHNTRAT